MLSFLRSGLSAINTFVICILILLLAAGYAASYHPIGDSLAVFRAQGAAALLAAAALCWLLSERRTAVLAIFIAAINGLPLIYAYASSGPPGPFTLYQKNMLFMNDDLGTLGQDIVAAAPDFITLQEVSSPNRELMTLLADRFPTRHYCDFTRRVGGTAVLSHFPAVPGTAICAPGMTALQVTTDNGPVWLISIHTFWPWPFQQPRQIDLLIPRIAALTGPKIIAGDFNMVPWSRAMTRFAEAGGVTFAQPTRGTYPQFGPLLTLPIDHVLTPMGGSTTLRPLAGSDHRGLLVTFDLPQPPSIASNP
ncbi:MAG: endonuclease/exonuclease/phosphatase family protein [Paracoccaceae bacterium]